MGALLPIKLLDNKGRFGLGYKTTHEELFQASRGKKRKYDTLGMSIPHIKPLSNSSRVHYAQTFKELEDEEPDLACIIRLCLKELSMNAILTPKYNLTSTIRLGMPGEEIGL